MLVTDEAKVKVAELLEGNKAVMPDKIFFLRITVMPGGCSGLKHQIYFDYETRPDDELFRFKEFDLRIDEASYPYLEGAKLEYFDTIEKQGFFLDNPNANNACACGDSFH